MSRLGFVLPKYRAAKVRGIYTCVLIIIIIVIVAKMSGERRPSGKIVYHE